MKKMFRIFAMTAVFFVFCGFSGCSVLSQTSDMDSDYQSTVVPFRAFSEGELSEAGFPEIDISEGWTNVVTFPDDHQSAPTGREIPRPEEFFFWLLMIMAGYCLFREITPMFEKRKDIVNFFLLLPSLVAGMFSAVLFSQNMHFIIWGILGLLGLVTVIIIFRFHFLWFLIIGFTYTLFLLSATETCDDSLPLRVLLFLFFGVGISFLNNLFVFIQHYFRRSV